MSRIYSSIIIALLLSACSLPESSSKHTDAAPATNENTGDTIVGATNAFSESNPFAKPSSLYLKYPPFDKINNSHYAVAFDAGMLEQKREIAAIAENSEPATIENTLIALEQTGMLLSRVSRVFYALASADTNDDIESLRTEYAPKLSAHSDEIWLNSELFARVQSLYERRDDLSLDKETYRLLSETHRYFVQQGALLSGADKSRLKEINAELASLQTQFSQNVKNEANTKAIVVDDVKELAGMSEDEIDAAKKAAKDRDMADKYVLPLLNTTGQPALASLSNRALREKIYKQSISRGSSGGEYDNRENFINIVTLRAEKAKLLGYANHAAESLASQTAKNPETVNKMLATLAPRAAANAKKEATELQKLIDEEGGDFKLAAWDWDFYTNKLREKKYAFDASQLKPYLELNTVLEKGVFYAAEKVFGLTFKARNDLPTYHPDVKVWEVFDADGSTLALFLGDFYARESKRGGAWMNAYVSQSKLFGDKPVVANHLNVPKPADGDATLLTWDEVETLFHEFGHALHGMFSDVNYNSLAGTSVPRDFVEYPSQVNEMWATWPQVLENYALHYETGEAMPTELLEKVLASGQFNQGFGTTEYLAASLLDQAWHQLKPESIPAVDELLAFEANALEKAGVKMEEVLPRYRTTYFSHITGGYSAGYYSYIWSEVLDADTVEWFKENGGMKRTNGDHFRKTLLSRGNAEEALDVFKNFRGAEPNMEPLLIRKGLTAQASGS